MLAVATILLLCGCGGGGNGSFMPPPTPATPTVYSAFQSPERVEIAGYQGQIQEPFASRDGTYLFFNTEGPDKNIHFATFIDATHLQYSGELSSINTPAVEGTPTMDLSNRFFFVSTANYMPPNAYDTLFSGDFDGSSVGSVTAVTGLAIKQPAQINFDVEVSADGNTLYFDDGDFSSGNNFPDQANIAIATRGVSGFTRLASFAAVMANVNTSSLEYAPAISMDELELFFTRFDPVASEIGIYRAVRGNIGAAFDTVQKVAAINPNNEFVEGPTLSADEKSLYFHRLNPTTGLFELYRVVRP